MIKYLTFSLVAIALLFGGGVLVASAQNYVPLAPLPFTTTGAVGSQTTDMGTYISGAIKLLIAIGGALSILIAVIGGVQYVASGIAPDAKNSAKNRIQNAVIGLLLIISSWLILSSISPDLVNFNLELPAIGAPTGALAGVTVTPGVAPTVWESDASERATLLAGGVGVKAPTCEYLSQRPCTSVWNLGSDAISGLIQLKTACGVSCTILVTGGVEYWMHGNRSTIIGANPTKHKPGNSVVDIRRPNPRLDTLVRNGVSLGVQPICSGLGPAYRYNGIIYVDEGDHWHACY